MEKFIECKLYSNKHSMEAPVPVIKWLILANST